MAAVRMGFEVLLCCFVALFGCSYGTEFVPVFIWEYSKPAGAQITSPALKKYSTNDFADFFVKKLSAFGEKPLVVVFTEENLSVEDFSWQDLAENSVFPHLESVTATAANADFIPSVESPLRALRRLEKLGYQWQTVRDPDTMKVPEHGGVVMVLKMEDARGDEDRPDYLRRHDGVMKSVYSRLVQHEHNVIGVYTGRYSSWIEPENEPVLHRMRRLLAEPAPATTYMLLNTSSIMIYASDKPQLIDAGTPKDLALVPNTVTKSQNATSQSLTAKFSTNNGSELVHLTFTFFNSTSSPGYWSLENIAYLYSTQATKVVLKPESSIIAPVMFSYHCSSKTVFKSENATLTFENFQAQSYMTDKATAFGDAYNCEPFFTPPIWSGLFVTSILALIMIWGLVMIMDIRTMDQFDDPKGKTITISATD